MKTESEIKAYIRQLRTEQHLSQMEVALRAEISRNAFIDFEDGPTRIVSQHVPRIAVALGVSADRLLLGYEPIKPGDKALLDSGNYADQLKAVSDEYEARIKELQNELEKIKMELEAKKECNALQARLIKELEEKKQ